jgi:hypothetical protein
MSDIAGRIRPTPPSLHYAILRHEGIANPHFDLMFETTPGSELATWRSPTWPIETEATLTRLKDHRRDYLSYEGPISGDRGHVRRVESGVYHLKKRAEGLWLLTFKSLTTHRQLEFRQQAGDRWRAQPPAI